MEIKDISKILDSFYCFANCNDIIIKNEKELEESLVDSKFQTFYKSIELFDNKLVCKLKDDTNTDVYIWKNVGEYTELLLQLFEKKYNNVSIDSYDEYRSFLLSLDIEFDSDEYKKSIKAFLVKVLSQL